MSSSPSAVRTVRSVIVERRRALRQQGQLSRELAAYDTSSARHDLDAVLDRYADTESAPIRQILRRQSQGPVSYHLSMH